MPRWLLPQFGVCSLCRASARVTLVLFSRSLHRDSNSAHRRRPHRLSSTTSRAAADVHRRARSRVDWRAGDRGGCVLTVINGGFPFSRPLASHAFAGPRGFLLHAVTRLLRPRLLSTPRRSATLRPLAASGSPLRLGLIAPPSAASAPGQVGLPWVRRTASPHAVRLHVGSVPRISGLARSGLLDPLPVAI